MNGFPRAGGRNPRVVTQSDERRKLALGMAALVDRRLCNVADEVVELRPEVGLALAIFRRYQR